MLVPSNCTSWITGSAQRPVHYLSTQGSGNLGFSPCRNAVPNESILGMASPRDLPAWLRAVLNIIAIVGVGATLEGWVQREIGVAILIFAPIYFLWEIWPWLKVQTKRRAQVSLVVLMIFGAASGAAVWWLLRNSAVPPQPVSTETASHPVPPPATNQVSAPGEIKSGVIPNTESSASTPKTSPPVHPRKAPLDFVFAQTGGKVTGFLLFNPTDEPIDNVSFSVMWSHAGPEYEADPTLLPYDLKHVWNVDVGTLRPQLATPIGNLPEWLIPHADKPSYYQVNIFTRYEAFTGRIYVTPNPEGSFDQSTNLSSNKTHEIFSRNAEKAMKAWKNWPAWWK